VDLSLLTCTAHKAGSAIHPSPGRYVALGELRGGIDPASADERWKTDRTALNRIREAFPDEGFSPQTFFVGAAIEKMAGEIWHKLEGGTLGNAANLTDAKQATSLSRWLWDLRRYLGVLCQ